MIRAHKRGRTKTQIAEETGLSYTAVAKLRSVMKPTALANATRLDDTLSGSMPDLISTRVFIVIFKDIKMFIPLSLALQLVYSQKR